MDDAIPAAEAVAIRDGRILAVGPREEVLLQAGKGAELRSLGGAALLPGFIDTHGHFAMMAQAAAMANLQPPPAGPVRDMTELQQVLRDWADAHPEAPWITGWGYDDSLLAEQRHPVRGDLDAVSSEKPILLMHTSAHLASCNTPCLAALGITPETQDPPGGVIRREADGKTPSGVLEEAALYFVFQKMPQPVESQRLSGIAEVQKLYASYGITTVQEGAARPQQIEDLRKVAAAGDLYLDVVAYQHFSNGASIGEDFTTSKSYDGHFRVGGIKLVLDGSPQGKTAWFTRPYVVPPPGQGSDYSGYAIYSDESVASLIDQAFARGIQVIAHANGDRAIDQFLDIAVPAIADYAEVDLRPVIIHAQTARQDQLEEVAAARIIPSFFAAHPFFWGDWHRDSVMGPDRASFISPMAAAADLGIPYTIHNDAPVVPPDMIRLLWVAENRETRSGAVLGPDQRATPRDALKAITANAAYQYFEEGQKGSISPGKLADLVILSANPLSVDPASLRDVRVVETFKDGISIYRAGEGGE
ncbi:amidohydrolase [Hyphomonas sp. WL0036]|nr:amidohydrolase [Hyphomonas sediminis]